MTITKDEVIDGLLEYKKTLQDFKSFMNDFSDYADNTSKRILNDQETHGGSLNWDDPQTIDQCLYVLSKFAGFFSDRVNKVHYSITIDLGYNQLYDQMSESIDKMIQTLDESSEISKDEFFKAYESAYSGRPDFKGKNTVTYTNGTVKKREGYDHTRSYADCFNSDADKDFSYTIKRFDNALNRLSLLFKETDPELPEGVSSLDDIRYKEGICQTFLSDAQSAFESFKGFKSRVRSGSESIDKYFKYLEESQKHQDFLVYCKDHEMRKIGSSAEKCYWRKIDDNLVVYPNSDKMSKVSYHDVVHHVKHIAFKVYKGVNFESLTPEQKEIDDNYTKLIDKWAESSHNHIICDYSCFEYTTEAVYSNAGSFGRAYRQALDCDDYDKIQEHLDKMRALRDKYMVTILKNCEEMRTRILGAVSELKRIIRSFPSELNNSPTAIEETLGLINKRLQAADDVHYQVVDSVNAIRNEMTQCLAIVEDHAAQLKEM